MIFPENRYPSPIGVEDMLFGIMLLAAGGSRSRPDQGGGGKADMGVIHEGEPVHGEQNGEGNAERHRPSACRVRACRAGGGFAPGAVCFGHQKYSSAGEPPAGPFKMWNFRAP